MNIRPSAAIRQNYNEIADLCRETAEPIFSPKTARVTWSSWTSKPTTAVKNAEAPRRAAFRGRGPDAWKRGLFDRRGHFHDAQCDQGGRRTWSSKINTA